MCCLVLIVVRGSGWATRAVASWWLYEEALVIGCSAWRMLWWWPVPAGAEQCSERLGVQLGALSLVVIAWLAVVAMWTTPNNKGGHEK